MKTLTGIMCVRDVEETDYCWKEAIAGMLPVCDQIVVCDSESTDGTREALEDLAGREKKIKIIDWKWPHPKGQPEFVVEWYNHARKHADCEMIYQNEADEVIHEDSYQEMRDILELSEKEITVRSILRRNFWGDAWHQAPLNTVCGDEVIRIAPKHFHMPSDFPDRWSKETCSHAKRSSVTLHHFGFIRSRPAFFKKARRVLSYFMNSMDPLLEELEHTDDNWMHVTANKRWKKPLVMFFGTHPKVSHKWLTDRGHSLICPHKKQCSIFRTSIT